MIKSADIRVGDVLRVLRGNRVPADMVLLHTTDKQGVIFLKTDQLDGETDWKAREAVGYTQKYIDKNGYETLVGSPLFVNVDPPSKGIYEFKGTFYKSEKTFEPLRLKNTLWANTTIAAGEAIGIVIYTGKETRMQMNSRSPRTKRGKTDDEINLLSILLFCFVMFLALSLLLLSGKLEEGTLSVIFLFRCILLLSSIIPISLRVNIDFAKIVYSLQIARDSRLEGTVVRNTAIPEELGRVEYLLSDKTGTLTKNEMVFKRLSTILANFGKDNLSTLKEYVGLDLERRPTVGHGSSQGTKKAKYELLRELVTALMVCHNVTPTEDHGERYYLLNSEFCKPRLQMR